MSPPRPLGHGPGLSELASRPPTSSNVVLAMGTHRSGRQTDLFGRAVVSRSGLLYLFNVRLGPPTDTAHHIAQRAAQLGQRVFNARRNTGINPARHNPVAFQAAKRIRQDLLRDTVDRPADLSKAQCPVRQPAYDEDRPFIRDTIQHLTCRAIVVEYVPR